MAILILVVMAGLASPAAMAVEDGRCRTDSAVQEEEANLPRTLRALRAHQPLKIVALGSSSTQGYGATTPDHAYPAQLSAKLKLRFPKSAIRVRNKGVGGDDIDNMLARFVPDVYAEKPDLVIWQTGTNDAINQVPLDLFSALLAKGIRDLGAHGIDVILMTPQFAPNFTGVPNYQAYLSAMRKEAAAAKVLLFDRYDPSRTWATDRHFADSPVLTHDGLHQTDTGYHCVAVLLADRLAALAR